MGSNEELIQLIGRALRTEIEIGTGKGLFLSAAARAQPTTQFIGFELAEKYANLAQQRLDQLQLTNARVFARDAVRTFQDSVPTGRIHAVHVYFPDPWWKSKHKKRRVLNDVMLQNIERVLTHNGELHFWTDVLDYYEDTIQRLDALTKLRGPYYVDEPIAMHDMDYRTHFERRTRLNGLPVYRARYVKEL